MSASSIIQNILWLSDDIRFDIKFLICADYKVDIIYSIKNDQCLDEWGRSVINTLRKNLDRSFVDIINELGKYCTESPDHYFSQTNPSIRKSKYVRLGKFACAKKTKRYNPKDIVPTNEKSINCCSRRFNDNESEFVLTSPIISNELAFEVRKYIENVCYHNRFSWTIELDQFIDL